MNQGKTPLFDILKRYSEQETFSYHVPGHKNGQLFADFARTFFQSVLAIDATEITGLDDLHAPSGPIMEAMELLAELYGADQSFFLVNGTTVGNLAMILSTVNEGDRVLVGRDCHKSILHGLTLAKAEPVFMSPKIDENWKVSSGYDARTVEKALQLFPDIKAVILTYPNYYGLTYDLGEIISVARKKNLPVLIDEAHGAHFILPPPFPESSVQLGADIVVQSAHKTLPAMTMGSFLHINSRRIDPERVKFYLQMLQSSSPSYPLMASLDLARYYLASYNEEDLAFFIKEVERFKKILCTIPEIEILQTPNGCKPDPLKITLRSTKGISGFQLQELLETERVYPELADMQNVLLILPLLKKEQMYPFTKTAEKIASAVKKEDYEQSFLIRSREFLYRDELFSVLSVPFKKMEQTEKEEIPLSEACGRISGEMIIPYPPGIPLIMEGEKITEEKLGILMNLLAQNANFQGGRVLQKRRIIVFKNV